MEILISNPCGAANNCESAKGSKKTDASSADSPSFDSVLQDEEKKISAEAEALMMTMLQKTAVQDPENGSKVSGGNPPVAQTVQPGVGQQASVEMQMPAAGTSQTADGETVVSVGTSADVVDLSEGAETAPTDGKMVSFQELLHEDLTANQQETSADSLKVDAEAAQRIDQAVKNAMKNEDAASQKGEINPQITSDPNVAGNEEVAVKNPQANLQENEGFKVHVEQTMQTSAARNEPARMAEAQNRPMVAQISEHIDALLQQGRSSLRLQLFPEELGKIDIRLVSSQHGLGVTVMTEQAGTGRLLEAQLDQLRQTLQEAGIQLSHLQIGQQQQNAHQRQSWFAQSRGRMNLNGNGVLRNSEDEISDQPRQIRTLTGVDYRV